MYKLALITIAGLFLASCAPVPTTMPSEVSLTSVALQGPTLEDKLNNRRQIKAAFETYLNYSGKQDVNRLATLSRLAEIEFEIGDLSLQMQEQLGRDSGPQLTYKAQLEKSISIFEQIMREYPRYLHNDDNVYQISRLYYLAGNYEKSLSYLKQLLNQYPGSQHTNEARFRLAEDYYSRQDYQQAERTYTEIIQSVNKDDFYEKSLFKRGWAQFKQQHYINAINDFMSAITEHDFENTAGLEKGEKAHFDEYFRAVSISYSYVNDPATLSNYFALHPNFQHIPHTYSAISDMFYKQQRYNDATDILSSFISNYPTSRDAPLAQIKKINILQEANFINRVNQEIESLFLTYQPGGLYWTRSNADSKHTEEIQRSIRSYMLVSSAYFHSKYQAQKNEKDFLAAQVWYKRFLNYYESHARRANIYYLYAELLSEHKSYIDAIKYYEIAAYDRDLVLNKDAAYATVVLSDRLFTDSPAGKKEKWLDKHLHYSYLFYDMYPDHDESEKTIIHASELAFAAKKYDKAIVLTELVSDNATSLTIYKANTIKAPSYFNVGRYSDAENIYNEISNNKLLLQEDKPKIINQLALSIYRQAESARDNKNIELAAHHYLRIKDIAPTSPIASTAMYDAIALFMSNQMWPVAISTIKLFQSLYPDHEKNNDVTKKLSVAYLNSNQELMAAKEFEKIFDFEKERNLKMAALWQAAEIYENKHLRDDAIRSYTRYAELYPKPYPQYIEAMNKVSDLYSQSTNYRSSLIWKRKIATADRKAPATLKTPRTIQLASQANLELARNAYALFRDIKLVEPIKTNLNRKKLAMKNAIKLYGEASSFGLEEITTEATYAIAEIYNNFGKALLNSERPKNLTGDQLQQYEILLEDQAYPFEEKSIEFFETNLAHTRNNLYNSWVERSHRRLIEIFPVRYRRAEKLDEYISDIY